MTHQTTLSRGRGVGETGSFDCLLVKTLGRVHFLNHFVHDCSSGLPRSAKMAFFQGQGKVGILCQIRKNSKFYLRFREKSGNFIVVLPQGVRKSFLVGKGSIVSKNIYE